VRAVFVISVYLSLAGTSVGRVKSEELGIWIVRDHIIWAMYHVVLYVSARFHQKCFMLHMPPDVDIIKSLRTEYFTHLRFLENLSFRRSSPEGTGWFDTSGS
jgi:hypothetical protein